MSERNRWRTALLAGGLAGVFVGVLILAGCAGGTEDVRITLCKDMVLARLNAPSVQWTAVTTAPGDDLAVDLRFAADGRDGRATCRYRYNAIDDTALTLADPLSAYATSPYRMTLDGREIANPQLAETIKQAMLAQGRAFLERASEEVGRAAEEIRSQLDGGR
jgi:hypothetical protein